MVKPINLIGQKFGKLTPNERTLVKNRWHYYCVCDCGKEIDHAINGSKLKNGSTKSCGCIRKGLPKLKHRKRYGEAIRNSILLSYKHNARRKNNKFYLTDEEAFELFQTNCFYCGIPPSKITRKKRMYGEYIHNGIDRKDNNLGYTKENSVACCKDCNFKKGNQDLNGFLEWIKKVYENIYQHKSSSV